MRRTRSLLTACLVVAGLAACQDSPLPTGIDPGIAKQSPDVHSGWIFGPDGDPIELSYVVINGLSIHEGDINLGPAGTVAKTREELLGRGDGPRYGVVIDGSGYRWGNGVVPYVISSSFDGTQRQYILDAMTHIASTTAGTQFRERTTESSYLYFQLGAGCNSPVGRRGGEQPINLTSNFCHFDESQRKGVAAHEILHSLGFWHEQSRCDRDTYITVHSPYDQDLTNFGQKCDGASDYLSYAEGSILHYGPFSPSGERWISSKRGLDYLMGQRTALHQTDISTINSIYYPYPVQGSSISYPSGTPTLSWNASSTATGYSVNFVVVYHENDDLNDITIVYDASSEYVGSTTGLSLQDTQRSYTGTFDCWLWSHTYGSAHYRYWYEIWPTFPDGIGGQGVRVLADVAPSSCS